MRVLVACEFSGTVRDAFIAKGHDAVSCDLLPTESPGPHIQGDVLDVIDDGWDMMIAHPPCTFLANSGVRWLYTDYNTKVKNYARWAEMRKAKQFFRELLEAPIPLIAIENPIQHKHGKIKQQDQTLQPWMFGDNETKAVCLWLKGLPPLVPTITKKPYDVVSRVWRMPLGPDRQKERSRFFPGMAAAMAEQWGNKHTVGDE